MSYYFIKVLMIAKKTSELCFQKYSEQSLCYVLLQHTSRFDIFNAVSHSA